MNKSTMKLMTRLLRKADTAAALKMLVLLAFVARSLIPLGFMPGKAAASNGLFPIVICSGTGSSTIYLPADKIPGQHPAHPAASHAPCVFAANAMFDGPAGIAALVPVILAPLLQLPRLYDAFVSSNSTAAYFPQGPPASLSQN